MNTRRKISLIVALFAVLASVYADEKDRKSPIISEKTFRQTSSLFLEDPLHSSARDWARLILLYSQQSSNAAVVLSKEELRWAGLDRGDPHSLLLLAAYSAGNIQSQLNSGVKRNDRYSGVLTLFRVYRALREKNERFRVSAVDDLLALHERDKLVPHLQKLDAKTPAKLTSGEQELIRRLMRVR